MNTRSNKTVLVTGGCGFIGSNLVRYLLSTKTTWRVINLDCLTYAGNLENLAELETNPRYVFEKMDIVEFEEMESVFAAYRPFAVINCAAETHVDRSLVEGKSFVKSNVLGTQNLLELAHSFESRFVQVSTDEVYGSLGISGTFSEDMPINPTSPYAASKAAADMLVLAAHRSYGQDVLITRSSNNYGPYQHPEKLIPLMITNALESKPLPVYGKGNNVRDWIHVMDHCEGLVAALERGRHGRIYNLGGGNEETNLSVVQMILSILRKPESLIHFVPDRPGHDLRYALDILRAQEELDWKPGTTFKGGIRDTVKWYVNNRKWWRPIKSGSYQEYYAKQYGETLREVQ